MSGKPTRRILSIPWLPARSLHDRLSTHCNAVMKIAALRSVIRKLCKFLTDISHSTLALLHPRAILVPSYPTFRRTRPTSGVLVRARALKDLVAAQIPRTSNSPDVSFSGTSGEPNHTLGETSALWLTAGGWLWPEPGRSRTLSPSGVRSETPLLALSLFGRGQRATRSFHSGLAAIALHWSDGRLWLRSAWEYAGTSQGRT